MFRRATTLLLNSVADVLDEMLAADFEFEAEEFAELDADRVLEPESARFALSGTSGGRCAGAARYHSPEGQMSASATRRHGSVPRRAEYCLTPVDPGSRPDSGWHAGHCED